MYQLLFFVFAVAAVGFAVNLLVQRHPIHSALSLIGVMASLASLYLMLGAEFIAPEGALPPQFAGFIAGALGMVFGSLLTRR